MEKFTEELNKFTENKFEFVLKSATLERNADFCVLEILYKDGVLLTAKEKKNIEKFALSILPPKYKYQFEYIKRYINEARVKDDTNMFCDKNFPGTILKIDDVKQQENSFVIDICVDELSFEHAKNKKIDAALVKFLKKEYTGYDFVCNIRSDKIAVEHKKEVKFTKEEVSDFSNKRKIELSEITDLVGEFDKDAKADYIKDKTSPEKEIVVCGTIQSIQEKVIKRKPKENDDDTHAQEEDGEKYCRSLYKMTIADFSGEMNAVYFATKETKAKMAELEKGKTVALFGDLEDDKFSGEITLKVKKIAFCKVPEKIEEYIEYKTEKPFYEFVEPEKIVIYSQDNLLNFAEEKVPPEYLKGKTFICYDLETTGLRYVGGDKMIEIGAVKIENGKITERFMSYVNPEMHIPAESTAISGIVDSDVIGAPTADKVLQDFYKWTRGATIIGYNNIGFDNIFLVGQGKQARWKFDNDTDDVFRWAQKYVRGVKNYKLKTIADKLGVALDNAHRAVFDALATAEVFIKINEIFEKDIKNTIKA